MLSVLVVLAACGDDKEGVVLKDISRSPQTLMVIPAGQPLVIGVSTALSGPSAPRGTEYRNAVALGVKSWKAANGDTIGGHAIEVHAEDDGCTAADVAPRAAERLLGREALVGVIGPQCSGGVQRAAPLYAEAGVVAISGSATRTDLTLTQPEPKFFFRTAYTNAQEGALQARYVAARLADARTVHLIDNSEAYGADLGDAAQAALEAGGRTVVREHIAEGTVDFSELAARIAGESPDVVIFEGFNPEAALFYRQLRDAGYPGPFLSGDGAASVSDFIDTLGDQAEGAIFAGCSPTLPQGFIEDYVEITGHGPIAAFPGHYSDAAMILLDAVKRVAVQEGGALVLDPLELREAVSSPTLLTGLSGAIAFDENGDRVGSGPTAGLTMCEVQGGVFVNFQF